MRKIQKPGPVVFLVALFLLVAPTARAQVSPLGAVTVGDFLSACQTSTSSCSSAVGTVLLLRINDVAICVSNARTDYTLPVIAWLIAHPETSAMTTSDGTILALNTVYRC